MSERRNPSVDGEVREQAGSAWSRGAELVYWEHFPQNLPDMLDGACITAPDRGLLFVDADGREQLLTYVALRREAHDLLAVLQERGLQPGDTLVLQCADERLFIRGFWAAVLGGLIPVPLAVPSSFPASQSLERVERVCAVLGETAMLTDGDPELYRTSAPGAVIRVQDCRGASSPPRLHSPRNDDTAYIQFSSGSTGDPKGVILTHANLRANLYAILRASATSEELDLLERVFGAPLAPAEVGARTLSWLPLSHDMGLIGFHLVPLAAGLSQLMITTATFVSDPALFLRLVHRHRVTQIPSPNFGLLWMLHLVPDAELESLDLSSVQVLFNGAEPISPRAVRLFCHRFARCGFNPRAMFPVYGMAEATLMVSAPEVDSPTLIHRLDREVFGDEGRAVPADNGGGIEFVDEGLPAPGMELRIVGENHELLREGQVGDIQIRGAHVTPGYHENPQATDEAFVDGWLKTGDLGFILNGRLTVTGRAKDVIFVSGQNLYAHDIEEEIMQVPAVGLRNLAVCGVTREDGERIVLFIKTGKEAAALEEMLMQVNAVLGPRIGTGIDAIVAVEDIPRTTSGKVRRHVLRRRYEQGLCTAREVRRPGMPVLSRPAPAPATPSRPDLSGLLGALPPARTKGRAGSDIQVVPQIIRTAPQMILIAGMLAPERGVLHVDGAGVERMQTYPEIAAGAARVQTGLTARGVRPGDPVLLLVDDQPSFLLALWGCLYAGALPAPLPVPGVYPQQDAMERVEVICSRLERCRIVADCPADYAGCGVEVLDIRELLAHEPAPKRHRSRPHDPMLLQFSSGSTGDPKGVVLTHRNVASAMEAGCMSFIDAPPGDMRSAASYLRHVLSRRLLPRSARSPLRAAAEAVCASPLLKGRDGWPRTVADTLLVLSGSRVSPHLDLDFDSVVIGNWMPYSHVMGLLGFHFGPTCVGFDQVTLTPRTFIENPALFLRLIDRYHITHIPCPNFAVEWLTMTVKDEDIEGLDLSCLRMLANGSEPVSPAATRAFLDRFVPYGLRPEAMCPAYGMSEATVEISFPHMSEPPVFHRVDRELFLRDGIAVPVADEETSLELTEVGAPVQGLEVRITDGEALMLSEYRVGHIEVRGPTVTRGYLANDEANAGLFTADGWMKTGDMGLMIGGRLVVTGRAKDMLIVNGQNVYVHDLEARIRRLPGMMVRDFGLCAVHDPATDEEQIVLFVHTAEPVHSLHGLLERVNAELAPGFGVHVHALARVDAIPRTPSAKIRRFKLREEYEQGLVREVIRAGQAAPAVSGEEAHELYGAALTLMQLWQEVLGAGSFGPGDNFFDHGGNSLRATRLASRIREEFGVEIGLRALFECPTIETQARLLEREDKEAAGEGITPLPPAESYPLSHAQLRLWYLERLMPGAALYNIPGAVLIEGVNLDPELLRRAFQMVVDRHETLRTVFSEVDGRPVQRVLDALNVRLPVDDLSGRPDGEKRLAARWEEEKRRPFDLYNGPLFRARVARLGERRFALLMVVHHIVADGWSMRVLVEEAAAHYFALLEGTVTPVTPLDIQYRDYAAWQERRFASGASAAEEQWWAGVLAGELPGLDLPLDRPRPPVPGLVARTARRRMGATLRNALRLCARRLDVTPFMLAEAVLCVVLRHLTDQEEVIIGSPLSGRTEQSIEPLIGFFVNVLPVRVDMCGDPDFAELVSRVRERTLGVYAHQAYPFDRLVELVNAPRSLSRNPLYDMVFEYIEQRENLFDQMSLSGVTLKDITGDDPHAKFDLSLNLTEDRGGVAMRLEYDADLFNHESMERLLAWYERVLTQVVEQPSMRLSEVSLMDGAAERLVQEASHGAGRPLSSRRVEQLVEEAASRFGDRPAVEDAGGTLSYAQLWERAGRLANLLRGRGLGAGDLVGICLERGADFIVSQLAVWRSGAAFVPVDPGLPASRLSYMFADAGVSCVLYDSLRAEMPSGGDVLCVDELFDELAAASPSVPAHDRPADDLAYVIYTSGSTGRPKGVMVRHAGVANLMAWHAGTFGIDERDRASQMAAPGFDAMIWEIWPYLMCGAAVCPLQERLAGLAPDELAAWMESQRISRAFVPTRLAEVLLAQQKLPLTTLFTGGDRLRSVPETDFTVINCYGPTEATVLATWADVTGWNDGPPPIGRPIDNVLVRVLDGALRPVPPGVPGEICIGGVAVGAGYLRDEERTRQCFVPDPEAPETLIYRTGDRGRWGAEGNLEFLGRRDFQLEIRGHRVEPGEVESVMREHPLVQDAAVVADAGGQLLGAWTGPAGMQELREHLVSWLPAYMVPARLVAVPRLPLTSSGKVDRRAVLDLAGVEACREHVEPATAEEELLCRVWNEVLGCGKVGVGDNFFDLGGDSILSLQVVSRLVREGYRLEPREILEYQTVAELAPRLTRSLAYGAEQGPVTGKAPLIPIQRWFMDRDLARPGHFNQSLVLKSPGRLDDAIFARALRAVAAHHDQLRACFTGDAQTVGPVADVFTPVCLDLAADRLDEAVCRLQSGFDPGRGIVFAAGLFHAPDGDRICLAAHHLVVDAVSWRIVVEDLFTAYVDAAEGREILLPPKTTSFLAWAALLPEHLDVVRAEADFWRETETRPADPLPEDFDHGPNDMASAHECSLVLDAPTTAELLDLARHASRCGVEEVLVAALTRALHRWGGMETVRLCLEHHGREPLAEDVDLSRTVGWFTTLHPLVLPCAADDSSVHLDAVIKTLRRAPLGGLGWGLLTTFGDLEPGSDAPVTFNYLGRLQTGMGDAALEIPGLQTLVAGENLRHALLDVMAWVLDDELHLHLVCSTNRHDPENARELLDFMAEEVAELLRHGLADGADGIGVGELDLVDLDEQALENMTDFS